MLYTVSQACRIVSQPRGGYIKLSDFEELSFDDEMTLYNTENISPNLVGMTVDYLTRFSIGIPLSTAFLSSIRGAYNMGIDVFKASAKLGKNIKGLDDQSIINACKLAAFDEAYRNPRYANDALSIDQINPDPITVSNIRVLVLRSISFWKQYGPVVETGFTFESPEQKKQGFRDKSSLDAYISGGYTYAVANGEGDYLTKDTLWDYKVSKSKPKTRDTLQILMYWIMGKHSGQDVYKGINHVGIYNPRLNMAYLLDITKVSDDVIHIIERDIFGYKS